LSVANGIIPLSQSKGVQMNLDQFRDHVLATRKASTDQAMSVLSATISNITTTKEGSND
jgi:hypothetical protein